MTLDEQLALFDRKAEQVYQRRLRVMKSPDHRALVLAEARRRLIEGFGLYGDSMFGRSFDDLCQAELEEDADAINYRLGRVYQGWPT